MFENFNEIAVVVASIFAAAVGSIWYSPLLFGTVWMKSIGLTLEEGEMPKREMMIATWKGVLVNIILFSMIAEYLAIGVPNGYSLVKIGGSVIIFSAMIALQSVLWEKRSIAYFFIQTGYFALSFSSGIAIIAYWPW